MQFDEIDQTPSRRLFSADNNIQTFELENKYLNQHDPYLHPKIISSRQIRTRNQFDPSIGENI